MTQAILASPCTCLLSGSKTNLTGLSMDRRYDKGERRFKHVGTSDEPVIEFDKKIPQKWIGKCPRGLEEKAEEILRTAIPAPKGGRDVDYDKVLHAVHDGAIYEAQTSDGGASYHGYPYRGKLSGRSIEALRDMATTKGCLDSFEAWVKKHIVRHGVRS